MKPPIEDSNRLFSYVGIVHIERMRENWQLNVHNSSSESVNSPKDPNLSSEKRLYDFSRPISAPPRSELNFNILSLEDDFSLSAWPKMEDLNSTRNPGFSHDVQIAHENGNYGFPSPIRSQSAAPIFSELKRNTSTNNDKSTMFNSFNSMTLGSNLNRSSSTGIIGQGNVTLKDVNSFASSSSIGQSKDFSRISTQDYTSNTQNLGLSLSRHSSGNFGSQNSLSDSAYRHDIYGMVQGGVMNGGSNEFMGRKLASQGNYRVDNHPSHTQIPMYDSGSSMRSASFQDVPSLIDRHRGFDTHIQSGPYYDQYSRTSVPTQPAPLGSLHSQGMHQPSSSLFYGNAPINTYGSHQFQQHPSQVHHQPSGSGMMHATDPSFQGRIAQQQYMLPHHGYQLHQVNPIQGSHTQSVTLLDSNGRPTTVNLPVVQSSVIDVSRKQFSSPNSRSNEKICRKQSRVVTAAKKSNSGSSLDASKHSLSNTAIQLLDEYRSSKNRNWTAHDVKGHITEFCQDQNGSRFIQQRLEVADTAEKELILTEVIPSMQRLRNDVFGNYVVQKLFDHGTSAMRSKLKLSMMGEVDQLSRHMYGCRVVQKALETVNDSDFIDLLSEFHEDVLSCIHDQNGNHVIQKVVEVVSSKAKTLQAENGEKALQCSSQLNFVLDCVMKNTVSLSCHPYGCRVLQRILEHCVESQKSAALDSIQLCLRTLLDDQYGNYVIQHVLQYGRKSDRDIILEMILENDLLALSRQKFASNVIEKLLKYGSSEHRNAIVREMLQSVEDKTVENGRCSVVLLMVRDAYANYVVQTTLDVAPEGEQKRLLFQELRNHSVQLRNYTFAKHIITKLDETNPRRFAS